MQIEATLGVATVTFDRPAPSYSHYFRNSKSPPAFNPDFINVVQHNMQIGPIRYLSLMVLYLPFIFMIHQSIVVVVVIATLAMHMVCHHKLSCGKCKQAVTPFNRRQHSLR